MHLTQYLAATLSWASIMTLTGLYRSRPMDQGVAHVGVCAVGNIFIYGNSIASIFLNCFVKNGEL